MLSSLPKLADRSFILGTFLPTLLFAIAMLILFNDHKAAKDLTAALAAKDLGQATFFMLAVWVFALVVLMLNHPIYRIFEGYTLPGFLADFLKARKRKHFNDLYSKIKGLHDRWAEEDDRFPVTDLERYRKLRQESVKWMPSKPGDILPTRFGNAIKAFEIYARDIYGADSIVVWLRLLTVIPKDFQEQIQDIRSQIDFLLNCSIFSAMVGLIGAYRCVLSGNFQHFDIRKAYEMGAYISSLELSWLIWAAGGAVSSFLFYRWAVNRVPAWGELVMSAFDCYLPALASQLGFELPKTEQKRLQFWTTFSQQLIYRREMDGKTPFVLESWGVARSVTPIK